MPPAILIILKIWGWVGPFIQEALATSNTLEWAKKHKSVVGLSMITAIQFIMVLLVIDQHQATSTKYQAAINHVTFLESELKHSEDKIKVLNGVISNLGVPPNKDLKSSIPQIPSIGTPSISNEVEEAEKDPPIVPKVTVSQKHTSTKQTPVVREAKPSEPQPKKDSEDNIPAATIRSRLDALSEEGA